ncbi:hypothetical protein GCM10007094_42380 [Pseudovibrio japonicus]|uniref:Phospholipid/glycerol acyltransferase domain-containing protein n=1 Tax=Pseudovibrio japonicus TaxID=366534 RepID=A0ABQ3ER39_9HYPH|nr:lysophospholipid acyltransferase family protein [Pseudovibrio japonicus]GHB48627.1 hypothetical protein GCM10007094_42380 [Pseudovibrio japonicus]
MRLALWSLDIRVDIDETSLGRLATDEGSLIVMNHKSHLDVPALMSVLPPQKWITFGAKVELSRLPFFKRAFQCAGILLIDRSKGSRTLSHLIDAYRSSDPRLSLALFAEGTRVPGANLGPFKPGAVAIARRLERSILPICIFGSGALLPKHSGVPKPGVIHIRVLEKYECVPDLPVGAQLEKLQHYMAHYYLESTSEDEHRAR